MIIDSLKNASRYYSVHPRFEKAFSYIQSLDLDQLEPGKFIIEENVLKGDFAVKSGKTVEESTAKFECHDAFIDIQVTVSGKEQIGWKSRDTCVLPNGEYNPEKDIRFFHDQPDMFFGLTNHQFAIFFPSDVHAPLIGTGEIRKMVIKVKID